MKLLIGCFILFISRSVFSNQESEGPKELTPELIREDFIKTALEAEKDINEFIKLKCSIAGGRAAYRRFVGTIEDLKVCISKILPQDYDLPSDICKDKRLRLRTCLEQAVPGINRCMANDEKWLVSEFIVGSMNSVFDYICGDIFNYLKEMMSLEGFDCLVTIAKNEATFDNKTDACFNTSELSQLEMQKFTKADLCRAIDSTEECLTRNIREQCSTNHGLEHLVQGFVQAFSSTCNGIELADLIA